MRVAIFGAGGQLGRSLVDVFAPHTVTAFDSAACDISDYEAVMSAVYACGPELIVNAAAMTAVDACETDPDRAFAVNAIGPRNLALAAGRLGADLLHVSTDYVFDGARTDGAYDEWDTPNPLSVYGRSKLAGEREVQTLHPRSYIARTAVVFSTKAPNFALAIIGAADRDGPLQVVADQIGCPTYVPHLAAALRTLAVSGRYGLYHVAGTGAVSRADLARALLAGIGDDPGRVHDVTTDSMVARYPAPRPANAALETRAWRLGGFAPLPHWSEGVKALLVELDRWRPAAGVDLALGQFAPPPPPPPGGEPIDLLASPEPVAFAAVPDPAPDVAGVADGPASAEGAPESGGGEWTDRGSN